MTRIAGKKAAVYCQAFPSNFSCPRVATHMAWRQGQRTRKRLCEPCLNAMVKRNLGRWAVQHRALDAPLAVALP
jgi:hypothetical protein